MPATVVKKMLTYLAVASFSLAFSSCSTETSDFCSGVSSVSGFTSRFVLGLDNFSENQYAQLRLDALDVYDTVMHAVENSENSGDAARLSIDLKNFINEMDKVSWDITRALQVPTAVRTATDLGTPETLTRANAVEAYVISECGLPSTVPFVASADTMPSPVIPAPTATDPPTNTINQNSEYRATGVILGTIYGLTLSDYEAECLGRELDGVVDTSTISGDSRQYTTQFQRAFDACETGFVIPAS